MHRRSRARKDSAPDSSRPGLGTIAGTPRPMRPWESQSRSHHQPKSLATSRNDTSAIKPLKRRAPPFRRFGHDAGCNFPESDNIGFAECERLPRLLLLETPAALPKVARRVSRFHVPSVARSQAATVVGL